MLVATHGGQVRRFYLARGYRTFGYVALRPAGPGQPVAVVDYLSPRRWVVPLLTLAAIEASRWGSIALTATTLNPRLDRPLRAAGFIRRNRLGSTPISFWYSCSDPGLAPVVHNAGNWFVTPIDGDLVSLGD